MVFLWMDVVRVAGGAGVRKLCIIPCLAARCCRVRIFLPSVIAGLTCNPQHPNQAAVRQRLKFNARLTAHGWIAGQARNDKREGGDFESRKLSSYEFFSKKGHLRLSRLREQLLF